jgi:plastocyanin
MKTTSRRSFFGHMFVASAEDSNVGIIDFAFKPAALTVKPGTTARSIPPLALA